MTIPRSVQSNGNFLLKLTWLAVACLALVSCTYQYLGESTSEWLERLELSPHYRLSSLRGHTIPRFNRLCVSRAVTLTPSDLSATASKELALELGRRYVSVDGPRMVSSRDEALTHAANRYCDFLFDLDIVTNVDQIASVVDLENGVDEISDFGFDRLGIKVSIWDVRSKQLVDTSLVTGRTPAIAFASSDPSKLLAESIRIYVDSVSVQQTY